VPYRRTWLIAFLGFLLLGSAWALATPYDGGPDEGDHIVRAYGVATGQVVLAPENAALGGGGFVDAPRSLAVDRCWQFDPTVDVSCAGDPGADQTIEPVATSAGRNAPIYYAIVGVPIAISPDWTGVLIARLLAVILCGLFLATALANALRWGRHRIMAAGVVVAVTPMVIHLVGSVNPSALELSAAVAFFAAAVPLLHHPQARRNNTLLAQAGLAAIALGTTRMLGPVWLGLTVLVLLLPWRRATIADLWGWRRLRTWVLAMGAAGVAGALWTLLSGGAAPNDFFQPDEAMHPLRIVWTELQHWSRYVDEMVGVTSWLDARLPELSYVVWPAVGGALVLWGLVVADRAERLRLVALIAVAFAAPMAISVALANTFGFITQGRYLLPLFVGVPILATFVVGERGVAPERARTVLRLVALLLLPIHVGALVTTLQRWQRGQGVSAGFNPFVAPWQPPLGPVLPLVAALAGLVLLAWLLTRAPRVAGSQQARRSARWPHVDRNPRPGGVRTTGPDGPASTATTAASPTN
jgi:hypothetical protein